MMIRRMPGRGEAGQLGESVPVRERQFRPFVRVVVPRIPASSSDVLCEGDAEGGWADAVWLQLSVLVARG